MKKIKCQIEYFESPHLNQIYTGFEILDKQGIINLSYKKSSGNNLKPILHVTINDRYKVIYDTLDGFCWNEGSISENLNFFSRIKTDFYFKRSFTEDLRDINPNIKIFPLGLNYHLDHHILFNDNIKNIIKNSYFFKKLKPIKKKYTASFFEEAPFKNKENKIIFFTRLWNPEMEKNSKKKEDIISINNFRIDVIRKCKQQFKHSFIGGIEDSQLSRNLAKDLIVNKDKSSKTNYLENVKNSNICISTRGLHDSIGWKFAEYVAKSKAIISEPLKYSLPGDFKVDQNYLEFNNTDELVQKIEMLLNNTKMMKDMMVANFNYYNEYVKPDKLVLNTILKIKEETGF